MDEKKQAQVNKLLKTLPGINHPRDIYKDDTHNTAFNNASYQARYSLNNLVNNSQYEYLNEIFKYIYIHTKEELLTELRKGVAWLEPFLQSTEYGILTERDVFNNPVGSGLTKDFKSAEWIARLALDKNLGMPELKLPALICTIDEHVKKPSYKTYLISSVPI